MKKYILVERVLKIIEYKHKNKFGWIGRGFLSEIQGKDSYMLYDSFPPLDVKNLNRKILNLKNVIEFYSTILNSYQDIENAEIKIETPCEFKTFAKKEEIIFLPLPREGVLWVGIGFAKEKHPYLQMDNLIQESKKQIKKAVEILKEARKEIPDELFQRVIMSLNNKNSKIKNPQPR